MEQKQQDERRATRPEGNPETGGRGKRKRWPFVVGAIVLVLLLLVGAAYAVFHHYFSLMGKMSDEPDPSAQVELPPEQEDATSAPPATDEEIAQIENDLKENLERMESDSELYATDAFNLLLLGVDSRDDGMTGRTDAMILISINKKTKQVTLTSFLRDIYLTIPGYGSERLNAAYVYGGTELLTETIRANFGIQVDRCVVVNFYLVMDFVDAVGGVDLELTAEEIEVMNRYIQSHNKLLGNEKGTDILPQADGTVHVNGSQALAYMRVRYVGTDFARTGRQRTVITKCMEKAKQMGLRDINGLAEEFLPRVRTDLTEGDCAALLLMMLNLSDYTTNSLTVPTDGTWRGVMIDGKSVLTIDFSANTKAWYDLVGGSE